MVQILQLTHIFKKYNRFSYIQTRSNFVLFSCSLSRASLNQVTFTFWDGTQSFPGGQKATIPHIKEEIQGYHMNQKTAIVISDFLE